MVMLWVQLVEDGLVIAEDGSVELAKSTVESVRDMCGAVLLYG